MSHEPRIPDPDLALIDALRAGHRAALEVLADRYGSRIYRVAVGITRNEADAEEVVQDVLLTIARKIGTFEGRSALWSWIFRIATNGALIKRRGRRREVEVPMEDRLPKFAEDGHHADYDAVALADWSRSPEADLLLSETRALLRRAIDRLAEPYRVVLVLRDVEGLSNEEAAEALGETVACVKSRLHRARLAVREQLTEHLRPKG